MEVFVFEGAGHSMDFLGVGTDFLGDAAALSAGTKFGHTLTARIDGSAAQCPLGERPLPFLL